MQLVLHTLQNIQDEQTDFRTEVRQSFASMNGRVRKTENSLLRWKTAVSVVGTVGTLVGFLIAYGAQLQSWLTMFRR